MALQIVQLMRSTTRDLAWLQSALQSAIELELSTLPPYLCGYWCLKDSNSYPATQLNKIFFQEMLHFGLACNLLSATGKEPEVLTGYGRISYPGPLPGGVVPACDGELVPCDPDFQVKLGFSDFRAFAWMATQIEYPEDPVPPPRALAAFETFPTIGQFYDAVIEAFKQNDGEIPYDQTNQQAGPLGITLISDIGAATSAIQLIQQQGEGGSKYPYSAPGVLSHFYAFGELYWLQKYEFDEATQTGDWSGDRLVIPDDQVYPMTPVPLGGYVSPPSEVVDFDRNFTQMLQHLDAAWSAGGKDELGKAIGIMPALTATATDLLSKQIRRPGVPGIYGPQFKIILSAPPAGGGARKGNRLPASFAKDIKQLFRPIDVAHMKPFGILLDDYAYMSDATNNHQNAQHVLAVLTAKRMPPGGPFWTQDMLNLFGQWMTDGYRP